MLIDQLLDNVKKELNINPESFDHAVGCWTKFISNYPENKEAVGDYCFKSLFQLENVPSTYSITKPLPIMVAIATSSYFNEILFSGSSIAQPRRLQQYHKFELSVFYINCLYFVDKAYIVNFNEFFKLEIFPEMDWDHFLVEGLLDRNLNYKFINHTLEVAIDYLFRIDVPIHYLVWNRLKSKHYFKLISLGFVISTEILVEKMVSQNFSLLYDKSWKRLIVFFYHNKALTPNLKRLFKTSTERSFITSHLEDITSNNALMLLIMM